jgi:hypothetical protein
LSEDSQNGRYDQPVSVPGQRAGHVDALIEAAFGTVDNQQRLALTHHGVFHRAERRLCRLATVDETRACSCQVMRKHRVDSGHGNDKDCQNDERDSAHDHRQKRS